MRWPARAHIVAIDRSPVMIGALWRRPADPVSAWAVRGDWAALPLRTGSIGLVIADGAFNMREGSEGWRSLAKEVARVLKPGGHCVTRVFARPADAESVDTVFRDLHAGRIGNPHILKWRLAMALHHSLEEGVALRDIWIAWSSAIADPGRLARQLGWSEPELRTIDVYRGVTTRYTFPTESELADLLGPSLRILRCHRASYPLGERCPILALES